MGRFVWNDFSTLFKLFCLHLHSSHYLFHCSFTHWNKNCFRQALKKWMSVNRNQAHSLQEVGNSLHHDKTEVLTFKSWLLIARRSSHKHKAHNTKPQIHKYLPWAGQCTHLGGEQPIALQQHSWAAWHLAVLCTGNAVTWTNKGDILPWAMEASLSDLYQQHLGEKGTTRRWKSSGLWLQLPAHRLCCLP